jgi:hypothetical protein
VWRKSIRLATIDSKVISQARKTYFFYKVNHPSNEALNFSRAKTFQTSPHMFNLRQRNPSYPWKGVFSLVRTRQGPWPRSGFWTSQISYSHSWHEIHCCLDRFKENLPRAGTCKWIQNGFVHRFSKAWRSRNSYWIVFKSCMVALLW